MTSLPRFQKTNTGFFVLRVPGHKLQKFNNLAFAFHASNGQLETFGEESMVSSWFDRTLQSLKAAQARSADPDGLEQLEPMQDVVVVASREWDDEQATALLLSAKARREFAQQVTR